MSFPKLYLHYPKEGLLTIFSMELIKEAKEIIIQVHQLWRADFLCKNGTLNLKNC